MSHPNARLPAVRALLAMLLSWLAAVACTDSITAPRPDPPLPDAPPTARAGAPGAAASFVQAGPAP